MRMHSNLGPRLKKLTRRQPKSRRLLMKRCRVIGRWLWPTFVGFSFFTLGSLDIVLCIGTLRSLVSSAQCLDIVLQFSVGSFELMYFVLP